MRISFRSARRLPGADTQQEIPRHVDRAAGSDAKRSISRRQAAVALSGFLAPHARRRRAMTAFAVLAGAPVAAEPLALARLVDGFAQRKPEAVIGSLTTWVGLACLCVFAMRRRDRLASEIAARVGCDLRIKLAERQLHARGACESLETLGVGGVEGVVRTLYPVFPTIISQSVVLVIGVAAASVLDWRVALFVGAATAVIAWLNSRLGARVRQANGSYKAAIQRFTAEARRFFHPAGRELVAITLARPYVMSRVRAVVNGDDGEDDRGLREVEEERLATSNWFPTMKMAGTILGVTTVGVAYLLAGVSLGTAVGFITLCLRQVEEMTGIALALGGFANSIPSIEMVLEGLAAPIERQGGHGLKPIESRFGRLEIRGAVASYADGQPVLNGLNLSLEPGEIAAVVGRIGSGKTTLTRLITGSEDLGMRDGQALLDDVPLSGLSLTSLRMLFPRLTQATCIFDGSVRENLLPVFGATDDLRQASQEDLEWACAQATLHDEIASWPDGYETKIDEGSKRGVSGGQGQAIGVARALIRARFNKPVALLLDEITANLDPTTSEDLLEAVLSFANEHGIGALVITHKLPVHRRVARVHVMSAGKVIESGDPRELTQDPSSAYARLLHTAGGGSAIDDT